MSSTVSGALSPKGGDGQTGGTAEVVNAVFERYMPDGPGYCGRVEVGVRGNQVVVTTWPEGLPASGAKLIAGSVADLAAVLELTDERFEKVFFSLDEDDRVNYLHDSVSCLDRDRVAAVRFSDGIEGAIVVWGECCFVSVMRYEQDGVVSLNVEIA